MTDEDRAPGFRTFTRAIDALDRTADPALLARLARLARVDIVPPAASYALPQSWRQVTLHLDPASYYAGYLGVRDEIEIPGELRRDLAERVPQAMLRDLHRMEFPSDEPAERRPMELGIDPGGREALKEARAAQLREPLPVIEPLVEKVMAEQERRRRFLDDPWEASLPDDAPREYREIFD
jgi:hypothetical protein